MTDLDYAEPLILARRYLTAAESLLAAGRDTEGLAAVVDMIAMGLRAERFLRAKLGLDPAGAKK